MFLNYLIKKNKSKVLIIPIVLIFLFINILFNLFLPYIPLENHFTNFKTIDEIVKYKYPKANIVDKFEYQDYGYVIAEVGDYVLIDTYNKVNGKWKYSKYFDNVNSEEIDDCSVFKFDKSMALVSVVCTNKHKISDSLNNEFKSQKLKNYYAYYNVVENIKEGYFITIDDKIID